MWKKNEVSCKGYQTGISGGTPFDGTSSEKKKPNTYAKSSVWASTGSRYYIDGKAKNIPGKVYTETDTEKIAEDIVDIKKQIHMNISIYMLKGL